MTLSGNSRRQTTVGFMTHITCWLTEISFGSVIEYGLPFLVSIIWMFYTYLVRSIQSFLFCFGKRNNVFYCADSVLGCFISLMQMLLHNSSCMNAAPFLFLSMKRSCMNASSFLFLSMKRPWGSYVLASMLAYVAIRSEPGLGSSVETVAAYLPLYYYSNGKYKMIQVKITPVSTKMRKVAT